MKLIRAVAIVLTITVLAWAGVHYFYSGMKDALTKAVPAKSEEQTSTLQSVGGESSSETEEVVDYQVIVTRNIFKAEEDSGMDEEEGLDEEELEETSLQLVLLGTVTGMEKDARAIIIDKKERKQNLYRIGELVQSAKIRKISRGKVVLEVNGKNEVLIIKDREGGGPQVPGAPRTTSRRTPAVREDVVREPAQVVRPRRRISLRQPRKVTAVAKEEAGIEEPEADMEEGEPQNDIQSVQQEPNEAVETEDNTDTY